MTETPTPKRTLISWSTGKDSAWTYHRLQADPAYEVVGLVCTINDEAKRTAMHAIRLDLLKAQADALGLPLEIIPLPYPCSNQDYEAIMSAFIKRAEAMEIEHIAFGDLYLADIRAYREKQMAHCSISPIFPLWNTPTDQLALDIVESGTQAIVTCVDPQQMPSDFAGREYNATFLADLPASVDPCGENGEFHTFVFAGPMLPKPINISVGETIGRDGFIFTDVLCDQCHDAPFNPIRRAHHLLPKD